MVSKINNWIVSWANRQTTLFIIWTDFTLFFDDEQTSRRYDNSICIQRMIQKYFDQTGIQCLYRLKILLTMDNIETNGWYALCSGK